MILFGCVLVLISVVLIILAWRGRTIERGEFCRACSFNLAGLPEGSESKCPECGKSIQGDANRRNTLRRKSVAGVLLGLVLLVAGGGLIGVGSSGMKSTFYAKLPDSIIVPLVTLGSDDALEELVPRLTRPQMMSDQHWERIIKHALDVQADPLAPWDPRIGEILANAWMFDRFSDEQLVSYLDHAIETKIIIRDRVRQGAESIPCFVRIKPSRMHSVYQAQSGVTLEMGVVSTQIQGDPTRYAHTREIQRSIGSYGVNVPEQGSNWIMGGQLDVQRASGTIDSEVGTTLQVDVEFEFRLSQQGSEEKQKYRAFTYSKAVRVIDPDEPIIELVENQAVADMLCEQFRGSQVAVFKEIGQDHKSWRPILGFSIFAEEGFQIPIAMRVLLDVDGEEIEIDQIIQEQSHGGAYGTMVDWKVDTENEEVVRRAELAIKRMLAQGTADVIFRTDPVIAEGNPAVDRVLNLELRINDLPISGVDAEGQIWASLSDPQWTHAACDN